MAATSARRVFLEKGALVGGGLLLTGPAVARASGDANEVLRTLNSLRTIHGNFSEKEIPEAEVETVLQTSLRAANASNMQSYSIVVTRDRARMKELCGYAGSCLMVFCVDYNRSLASARSLGHSYSAEGTESFVTGAVNTVLCAQTAVIAAKALGIDSLLTNGIHRGDMERVWRILDLPEQACFPLIALVLGYPTSPPEYRKGRLDGAGVIHRERYHRITPQEAEEITRRYDDPREHLGLVDDWKAGGHAHYLDWFFKEWVGRRGPLPTGEAQMQRLLKRCGFVDAQK